MRQRSMIDNMEPARVLVTGSISYEDRTTIVGLLDSLWAKRQATGGSFRIITGMADGADQIARMWAEKNGVHLLAEPLSKGRYPDPMHDYNEQMMQWAPELVLAFKDNLDPAWASEDCIAGTEHMVRIAAQAGIPVLLNGTTGLTTTLKPRADVHSDTPTAETRFGSTNIVVLRGDITHEHVDVIVNAANSSLLGGGGVDGAIHRAAGPELLEACRAIVAKQGGLATGEAVITSAGQLHADYVVHTVGPVWPGIGADEAKQDAADSLLARSYSESLRLAAEAGATSISFPNISTGVYRYPLDRAAAVALAAVKEWLATNNHQLRQVRFVCFGQDNFDIYARAI